MICDAKAAQLEEYVAERKADARYLADAPAIRRGGGPARRHAPGGQAGRPRSIGREAEAMPARGWRPSPTPTPTRTSTCSTPTGALLVSLPAGPGRRRRAWRRGRSGRPELAAAFRRAEGPAPAGRCPTCRSTRAGEPPSAFVVGAGPQGRRDWSGVIALELDGATVFESFNTYFGLGETGDATVAMREGDEITYVAPTRFNPTAAFRGPGPARLAGGPGHAARRHGATGASARWSTTWASRW